MKFGENDFDKDSDRRAWRAYAAAAFEQVRHAVNSGLFVPVSKEDMPTKTAELAGSFADAMLAEERKRR
jgi:hypothetical protein